MKSRKGFTLIELLIVIAVIGILASAVLVGLGPVQRSGRDARRASDLRQMQNALELYSSRYGCYPYSGVPVACVPPLAAGTLTWANMQAAMGGPNPVVAVIPVDPRNTGTFVYDYYYNIGATGYVLRAMLEDANSPLYKSDVDGAPVAGFTAQCGPVAPAVDTVYCVQL